MKIQKVFSKRTADTWEMVARVQNYKKENRNSKGNAIAIMPTQIYGPSAVPEKMARFIKSNRYFCKSDQVNSNSKTEKKAAVEKGIMKKLVNE